MIDQNFVLLTTIVVTIITILLVVIGVQLFLVLRDLRRFLQRANSIVEELEKVGVNVGRGYSEITGFLSSFKTILHIIDALTKRKKKK